VKYSSTEMLKYAIENGIIDAAIVAEKLEMAENQRYLDMHTGKIWLASDGYYKTKLKGDDGKSRLVKKKNRNDLDKVIIEHYKTTTFDYSFKARYQAWIERQIKCMRSDNTINKYESDYKRFFLGYPIETMDIRIINDEDISEHLISVLKDREIRWRTFESMVGYINGVFEKAIKDRIIKENPCQYLDLPLYKRYCYVPPIKTTKERTLSNDDMHILLDRLHNPSAPNTNIVVGYAIELAIYTGMRVGEIAGLMWEDIIWDESIIIIRHSERRSRITKISEVTTTKNGKERIFPLIPEIVNLLKRTREYEEEHGFLGKYVFQDENGRLKKDNISASIRRRTRSKAYSGVKSIHAIRRTVNSKLKCNGVSSAVASSLLGHTERVNEANYTYDVTELEQKRRIVTSIVT